MGFVQIILNYREESDRAVPYPPISLSQPQKYLLPEYDKAEQLRKSRSSEQSPKLVNLPMILQHSAIAYPQLKMFLETTNEFGKISGLKLNASKTKAT